MYKLPTGFEVVEVPLSHSPNHQIYHDDDDNDDND